MFAGYLLTFVSKNATIYKYSPMAIPPSLQKEIQYASYPAVAIAGGTSGVGSTRCAVFSDEEAKSRRGGLQNLRRAPTRGQGKVEKLLPYRSEAPGSQAP